MAQVKVYGRRDQLDPIKARLSDVIHGCIVAALQYPPDKRFHRFFPLAADDFIYPADRSKRYTIIEISLFEGRSVAAKKALVRLLYERTAAELDLAPQDLEITLSETPRHNWGIRGQPGDELGLTYTVAV
ncbi:MAG: tautomerase family protein [Chloroflexi bacterium]|nr:tautomerase family protein [Chloroflexota bacterium]